MTKPVKIGLFFALTHFVIFLAFAIYMKVTPDDGQLVLLWGLWFVPDLPVSFLWGGVFLFLPEADTSLQTFMATSEDSSLLDIFNTTNLAYFIHGILGTIWWFYMVKWITEKKIK